MWRIIVLVLFASVILVVDADSPTVQISSGLIEGEYVQSNIVDTPFYSFRGIPYAEPPVGKLRFQPPVQIKPWTKTLETKKDGSACVQKSGGSEDCLFLNVYTPKLPVNEEKSELLPVMVFIHGGAFVLGSSSSKYFGPHYLVDKNVILVTLNYRLNIFGFLNSRSDSAPGNAGLKDQVLALKWVQENIEKFGGDKDQITIFGHSAGAASVQYLIQSQLAKGLFHRAILQSGSTLNNWAFETDPLDLLHKLGEVLNTDSKNVPEFVDKLKTLSSEELFNASTNQNVSNDLRKMIRARFIPSLEHDSPTAFMTENSYSLLSENKINSVPIMMGYVSGEALFFLQNIEAGKFKVEDFETNPKLLVPLALNIKEDSDNEKSVLTEIKDFFFDNVSVTNATAFLNFESDETFVRGIRKTAELLRSTTDIYFYVFGYKDKNDKSPHPEVPHVGELKYIFYTGVDESDDDKKIRQKMTTLWTNCAKTGNPIPKEDPLLDNVKWPKVSKSESDKLKYLDIGEQLTIQENPGQEKFDFWETLFKKYGNPPFSIY